MGTSRPRRNILPRVGDLLGHVSDCAVCTNERRNRSSEPRPKGSTRFPRAEKANLHTPWRTKVNRRRATVSVDRNREGVANRSRLRRCHRKRRQTHFAKPLADLPGRYLTSRGFDDHHDRKLLGKSRSAQGRQAADNHEGFRSHPQDQSGGFGLSRQRANVNGITTLPVVPRARCLVLRAPVGNKNEG